MYNAMYYFYLQKAFSTRRSGIKELEKMFKKHGFQIAYDQKEKRGRGERLYHVFSRKNGNKSINQLRVWYEDGKLTARLDSLPDGHGTDREGGPNGLIKFFQMFEKNNWLFEAVPD